MNLLLIFKYPVIFEYFLIFYTVQYLDIPRSYLNIPAIFKYGLVISPYFISRILSQSRENPDISIQDFPHSPITNLHIKNEVPPWYALLRGAVGIV